MLSPEEFEEVEAILAMVVRMRRTQRRYYAGEKQLLGLCREIERSVDGALEAHASPSLFDPKPPGSRRP